MCIGHQPPSSWQKLFVCGVLSPRALELQFDSLCIACLPAGLYHSLKYQGDDYTISSPRQCARVPTHCTPRHDTRVVLPMSDACALQANALARHLVLQEYKESQFPGGGSEREMLCLPWNAPPGTDNAADEPTIVLTARLEAVEILLRTVPLARLPGHAEEKANCDEEKKGEHEAGGSRKKFGSVVVDEDSVEEQHCWRLLLGARQAYTGWASVHRAKEQQQQRWSSQRSSTREQLAR